MILAAFSEVGRKIKILGFERIRGRYTVDMIVTSTKISTTLPDHSM